MTGWEKIIGHDWAVELLRSSIDNDRIGHAHLITGPAHIGKNTLALTFTKALNCLSGVRSERPCDRCRACKLIDAGRYPDVIPFEPNISRWGKKSIGIGKIREMQAHLSLTATEARYKVAIINDFEAATINAANAFLKTLEEPPTKVILLLTALSTDSLLPTIPSRCRVINLRPLPRTLILKALANGFTESEISTETLSQIADGRIGWALSARTDPTILETRSTQLAYLIEGLEADKVGRFSLAEMIVKSPEKIPNMLLTWLSWWRDVNLIKNDLNALDSIANVDLLDQIEGYAHQWTPEQALDSIVRTQEIIQNIERNANIRLAIENLLIAYPGIT